MEDLVNQDSLELARLIHWPGVQKSGVEQNDPPRYVGGRQVGTQRSAKLHADGTAGERRQHSLSYLILWRAGEAARLSGCGRGL
jgi:hypothetical protein